jgi:hypothetical protein
MTDQTNQVSPLFLHLVLSLQSAAMYQLGKIVSPISGQIERDLEQARISIDLLIMLQEKTKGNLLEEEKRSLDSIIYNLQMNYIDELNEGKSSAPETKPNTGAGEADSTSSSSASQ